MKVLNGEVIVSQVSQVQFTEMNPVNAVCQYAIMDLT